MDQVLGGARQFAGPLSNASTLANDPLVALLFFCHRTSQAKPIDWHSNYSSGGGSSIREFLIYDFEIPEDETELRAFGEFCANLQPN